MYYNIFIYFITVRHKRPLKFNVSAKWRDTLISLKANTESMFSLIYFSVPVFFFWEILLNLDIIKNIFLIKKNVVLCNGCVFDSHSRKFNILYFNFLHSGVGVKRGIEFRHITRNAFRIWCKNGERSVLILGSLCLSWCVLDPAWN